MAGKFNFRKLGKWLCAAVYLSTFAVGLLALATHESPNQFLHGQFSLTTEANVPTWLASTLWLFVALASFVAYIMDKVLDGRKERVWLFVASAFLYASFDEICRLHERIPRWQIAYLPAVLSVSIVGGRFLWLKLKNVSRGRLMLVSCALCYAVALVLECFAQIGSIHDFVNQVRFIERWNLVEFTEEMLELLGTAFILHALINYSLFRWENNEKMEPAG